MKEVYARMIFQLWGRMTFGPSKRHEATRYVTRGGGWKKHGNRISSHPLATPTAAGRGMVPSFRRRNFVPGFVRLVVLTPSLIKSLYFFSSFPPRLPVAPPASLTFFFLHHRSSSSRVKKFSIPSSHSSLLPPLFPFSPFSLPQLFALPFIPLFVFLILSCFFKKMDGGLGRRAGNRKEESKSIFLDGKSRF